MATITVSVESNLLADQIVSAISLFKGIKKIELKNDTPKTETELLLEKMDRGEYVSDDEYLRSIPGMMESIEEASREPIEECATEIGWEWDV